MQTASRSCFNQIQNKKRMACQALWAFDHGIGFSVNNRCADFPQKSYISDPRNLTFSENPWPKMHIFIINLRTLTLFFNAVSINIQIKLNFNNKLSKNYFKPSSKNYVNQHSHGLTKTDNMKCIFYIHIYFLRTLTILQLHVLGFCSKWWSLWPIELS